MPDTIGLFKCGITLSLSYSSIHRVSVFSTGIASAVIEMFIAYAEWFFPGGELLTKDFQLFYFHS